MPTLTIRLPDDTHQRLRELARRRSMSINKLMEELATISITEFDAETRFRALAASGSVKQGLALLDRLDEAFQGSGGFLHDEFRHPCLRIPPLAAVKKKVSQ